MSCALIISLHPYKSLVGWQTGDTSWLPNGRRQTSEDLGVFQRDQCAGGHVLKEGLLRALRRCGWEIHDTG